MKDAKFVRIDEDGRHVYQLPGVIHHVDIKIDISEAPEMIEVKAAELIGEALDWAVAKAEGLDCGLWKKGSAPGYCVIIKSTFFCPATKWSDCGPLIDKHAISLLAFSMNLNGSPGYWVAEPWVYCPIRIHGDTALIAACRAIVAAKLGDTVGVPKELMQ